MRVLVISAHADDETLGCGGTLLRHRSAGDELYWLIATQAHEPQWTADLIHRKTAEVQSVAQAYGIVRYFPLGFPAARLDTVPVADVMARVGAVIAEVRPEVVYVVHGGDVHSDHRVLFGATASVLRPIHMRRLGIRRVLCYEILSSTEAAPSHAGTGFQPHVFVDITDHFDRKTAVMALYATEAQADPLPRGPSGMRALARYRGASVGVEYAEAFMLIRELT
jgi:LmbE family N-acetylglucosaminyl deacetylase